MPKTHRKEHLSRSHTTRSCVLMNAPDLFCRNRARLLLATASLSLIKLPAAPLTNTLLISRLLLAKTDFRLYTKHRESRREQERRRGKPEMSRATREWSHTNSTLSFKSILTWLIDRNTKLLFRENKMKITSYHSGEEKGRRIKMKEKSYCLSAIE